MLNMTNRQWATILLMSTLCLGALVPAMPAATIPVFVFAGQSNALARKTDYAQLTGALEVWKTPQANVLFAGPQGEQENGGPTWGAIAPVNANLTSYGPELSAGKVIAQGLNQTVGVIKYAKGSTWLANKNNANDTWDPDKAGGLYSQMLNRVNLSLAALPVQQSGTTGDIAAFFWMQGENDAISAVDANAYQQNLIDFIAKVRTDFNKPELPFIFGQINVSDNVNYTANSHIVRAAQQYVASNVANVYMVDTHPLSRVTGDFVHLSTQGTLDLGTAWGNLYLTAVPEPTSLSLLLYGFIALLVFRCKR
jgi:hypothetical protein